MTKIAAQAEKDKLGKMISVFHWMRIVMMLRHFIKRGKQKATQTKNTCHCTDSYSGRTARNLAAFREVSGVLAICYKKKKTMRHFGFVLWCEAIYMPELIS